MADAVQCFKPGWRALDSSGDPLSGATLEFFDAGTSNARTVYSTNDLTTTSLGDTVTCDSGGFPTSDGNTKVEVYTGTGDYKIICKNSSGTTIWTLDNIRGATDTSGFLTSANLEWISSVVNSSSNQTPGASDGGRVLNLNCTAGDVTVTLADAATNGDNWKQVIRHNGTANQVLITTSSGTDLFDIPGHAGVTDFALTSLGQAVTITCDGVGYTVEESSPALMGTTGVIVIADRLATPPVSPQAGARYILTSGPSGDWSSFAENDIAEADGAGGWFKFTPAADSGLIAYVQDEDVSYQFLSSSWIPFTASNAPGTSGQFLQSQGSGSAPAYANVVSEFVETGSFSNDATKDFTIPAGMDELEIVLLNLVPGTDLTDLYMRFSQSSAFLSGASDYMWRYVHGDDTPDGAQSAADTKIVFINALGTGTNERLTLKIRIYKPSAASTAKVAIWEGGYNNSTPEAERISGWGQLIANTDAIDGFQFLMSSGNIASGEYMVRAHRWS